MSRLFWKYPDRGGLPRFLAVEKKIKSVGLLDLQILDVKHVGQHV